MRPLTVGLAFAVLPFTGPPSDDDVSAAALHKDSCALITTAEVKAALDADADINSGVPDASTLPLGVGCTYTWGPRTKEWGQPALTITVVDATKAWQGLSSRSDPAGNSFEDNNQRAERLPDPRRR